MKYLTYILTTFVAVYLYLGAGETTVHANEEYEETVVYFYSNSNEHKEIQPYLDDLEDEGIHVIEYDKANYKELLDIYKETFSVSLDPEISSLLFVGNEVYIENDMIITNIQNNQIQTQSGNPLKEVKIIVYFYSPSCSLCQATHPYVEELKDEGIHVIEYNTTNRNHLQLFDYYKDNYSVPTDKGTVPLLFVGTQFYFGKDTIIENIENNTIQTQSVEHLKDIDEDNVESNLKLEGFIGFVTILFSGLLDGFNPCAMAMLLLFISLLGFSSKKSTLILVSSTYIFALFISYFALGTFLFQYLYKFQDQISFISKYISWFIIILCSFLFVFNFYDYLVSKNEDYKKIKNQLPKGIQKFNKKIIKKFTALYEENEEGQKSLWVILLLTFVLGVIISLTEFMCTGQIYLPIIISLVQFSDSFNLNAILYLLLYNFMFVLPLIVIAVVSIKTRSVLTTSNYIREKLHVIKLLNSLLFLGIALVYIFKLL